MNYPPRNQGTQNGMFGAVVNNAAAAVGNAANAVGNAATNAAAAVTNVANNTMKNFGKNLNKAANAAVNVATNTVPAAINSLIPFTNNIAQNGGPQQESEGILNTMVNQAFNGNGSRKNNAGLLNSLANQNAASVVNSGAGSFFEGTLGIFIALFTVFLVIFAVFNDQIRQGYEYMIISFKQLIGIETQPDVVSQITPAEGDITTLTQAPPPPSEPSTTPMKAPSQMQNIVEKILPTPGSKEVFNISQNKFTFYDAEPLCKALGAELATYDQVRDAWAKGADWCNYGWVKGQMAIYPTQKETYEKLQGGPPEEKRACGTVGVNGGVFDNPELRFGVNCFGPKPSQTSHDEKALMEQGKIPRGPETLAVDKKIAEFKEEADSLFVRPFNSDKWHA